MLPLGVDIEPADKQLVELQALQDYRVFAATTIQRFVRGYQCRRRLANESRLAASTLARWEDEAARAALVHRAVVCIQQAWRNFTGRRTFAFYKDLLGFREAGDPRELLRTINPREAQLLDPALGAHVRFRLEGATWPPLVMYKIFTHRPVADICAFGPRDYAAEAAAQQARKAAAAAAAAGFATSTAASSSSSSTTAAAAGEAAAAAAGTSTSYTAVPDECRMYLKHDGTIGYRSTAGWYRRQDNNNWRPVVDRLLLTPQQQQQWGLAAAAAAAAGGGSRRGAAAAGGSSSCDQRPAWGCSHGNSSSASCSHGQYQPPTHYSSLVRKAERARLLKQKRREWLLKLYRAGMAGGELDAEQLQQAELAMSQHVAEAESAELGEALDEYQLDVAAAAAAAAAAEGQECIDPCAGQPFVDDRGQQESSCAGAWSSAGGGGYNQQHQQQQQQGDPDWDALEGQLLSWAHHLDFDAYSRHWSTTAVSLGTEAMTATCTTAIASSARTAVF